MPTRSRFLNCFSAQVLVWVVCGCQAHSTAPESKQQLDQRPRPISPRPDPRPQAPRPPVSLQYLDSLLGTAELQADQGEVASAGALREALKPRLASLPFYRGVSNKLLSPFSGAFVGPSLVHYRLARSAPAGKRDRGRGFYYIETFGKCKQSELIEVHPWWNLESTVLVCPRAYRPDVRFIDAAGQLECEANTHLRDDQCGCGPFLINCAPDAFARALREAAQQEVIRTVAYVGMQHEPLSTLLTRNDTVRSSLGEYWYARSAFLSNPSAGLHLPRLGDDQGPDPEKMEDFEPRPRAAHFGGGILSTPFYMYYDNRRVAVADIWSDFLCTSWKAVGVEAHVLLEAARTQPDLRSNIQQDLVTTPGCRTCHVRLEYGILATSGFREKNVGSRYVPASHAEPMKFYVRDEDDLRAEGTASLAWLGSQIVAQPEFTQCIGQKLLDFAFEGTDIPEESRERLLERFNTEQDVASLMEEALVVRYFGAVQEGKP